jgi:hypothetical protein
MEPLPTILTGVGAGVITLVTWLRVAPRNPPAAAASVTAAAAAAPLSVLLGLGAASVLLGAALHLHQPATSLPKVPALPPRGGSAPVPGGAASLSDARGSQTRWCSMHVDMRMSHVHPHPPPVSRLPRFPSRARPLPPRGSRRMAVRPPHSTHTASPKVPVQLAGPPPCSTWPVWMLDRSVAHRVHVNTRAVWCPRCLSNHTHGAVGGVS